MKYTKFIQSLTVVFLLTAFFFSCQNEDLQEDLQQEITKEAIRNLIKSKNPNFKFVDNALSKNPLDKSKRPEPMRLNSMKELSEFLDEINMSRHDFTHSDNEGSGTGEAGRVVKQVYMGLITHNTAFYVNSCVGSGINSYITGFTLGQSYEHLSGETDTLGDRIYYQVDGTFSYDLLIGGLSEVFTEDVTFYGQHACN